MNINLKGKIIGLLRILKYNNYIQVIISRLLFNKTKTVIHRIEDLEIAMDYTVGEQNGTGACVADKSYGSLVEAILLDRKKPINVLDLGANGGGFVLLLHLMGYNLAKIVAVEMNQRTFARLSFNILRNLNGQINLIKGAVSGRKGEMTLADCDGGISDSIYAIPNKQSATRTVSLIPVNELIYENFPEEQIDIIKIDIEGAEFEILESEAKESLKKGNYILMEIHNSNSWSYEKVHNTLKLMGFDLLENRSDYEANVFLYKNLNSDNNN